MAITLFPDQQQAVDIVLEKYKECPIGGKALIVAPTAWGKTIFFSSLIYALKDICDKPILIIAHRQELLLQAREKIHMVDPTAIVGIVGGGIHEWGYPITVASIDTIRSKKHLKQMKLFNYGLIITDECHHGPAPKYMKVFNVLTHAFFVGVTATPNRLDGKSLDPLFGPPLFQMTILAAIQQKRLANVRAIAIRTETDLDQVASKKNKDGEIDFDEGQLDLIINTPERNRRIVESYLEHCPAIPFVAFCVSVSHAEALSYTFNDMGISVRCVSGSVKKDENKNVRQKLEARKNIYKEVESGEVLGMTNVYILTEGFDLPAIKCVILARPTQSESLYKQMIGRGMRLYEGQTCTILDITDNTAKYRLQRQSLHRATEIHLKDNETLLDAVERIEREEEEKKKCSVGSDEQERYTKKRLDDIIVDLTTILEWQEQPNGSFTIEVSTEKHKIGIAPSKEVAGFYYVAARLAPNYGFQKWSGDLTLEEAQILAEKRILKLHHDGVGLVDVNAEWRKQPASAKQLGMLKKYRIEPFEGMTRGQASDLIDQHKQQIEDRKRAKAARKLAKLAKEMEQDWQRSKDRINFL